jgi:hypothetical protein
MEGNPKNVRSGKGLDYLNLEVLPPEIRNKEAGDLDPFIKLISRLLDTFFVIPGTRIRFGVEPIIGLIPIFGDHFTSLISAALVSQRPPSIAKDCLGPNGTEYFN